MTVVLIPIGAFVPVVTITGNELHPVRIEGAVAATTGKNGVPP